MLWYSTAYFNEKLLNLGSTFYGREHCIIFKVMGSFNQLNNVFTGTICLVNGLIRKCQPVFRIGRHYHILKKSSVWVNVFFYARLHFPIQTIISFTILLNLQVTGNGKLYIIPTYFYLFLPLAQYGLVTDWVDSHWWKTSLIRPKTAIHIFIPPFLCFYLCS